MSLIEHELAKLPSARLRELTRSPLRLLAEAAQAELDDRPKSRTDELREAVFPQTFNR